MGRPCFPLQAQASTQFADRAVDQDAEAAVLHRSMARPEIVGSVMAGPMRAQAARFVAPKYIGG